MDKKRITKTSEETFALGSEFSKKLKAGDLVLLFGELGSGKTTFIQGVAKGLGVTDRIISPTFVLIRQYEIPHPTPLLKGEGDDRKSSRPFGLAQGGQARTRNLYHVDLYRIEKPSELAGLGLGEVAEQIGSITLIEWADRLPNFKSNKSLPAGRQGYKIYFKHLNESKREITIKDYE